MSLDTIIVVVLTGLAVAAVVYLELHSRRQGSKTQPTEPIPGEEADSNAKKRGK